MGNDRDIPLLAGRLLLALIFVLSGVDKLTHYGATLAYMAATGLPSVEWLAPLAIAVELGGGLMVAFGFRARWGASALILFTLTATLLLHGFWAVEPGQMQNQMFHFQKNLALIGGLLYVAATGPGSYSLDGLERGVRGRVRQPGGT